MNPALILRAIHAKQPIDRADLRHALGMSESSFSQYLTALKDEGLVHIGEGYKAKVWLTLKGRERIE